MSSARLTPEASEASSVPDPTCTSLPQRQYSDDITLDPLAWSRGDKDDLAGQDPSDIGPNENDVIEEKHPNLDAEVERSDYGLGEHD